MGDYKSTTQSVYDYEDIRKIRIMLFPPDIPESGHNKADIFGSSLIHCGVCPIPYGKPCSKTCAKVREELTERDGVKVE